MILAQVFQFRHDGGALVDLDLKQSSQPLKIDIWNTVNQWRFVNVWNVKPSAQKESPPTEDFLTTVLLYCFFFVSS